MSSTIVTSHLVAKIERLAQLSRKLGNTHAALVGDASALKEELAEMTHGHVSVEALSDLERRVGWIVDDLAKNDLGLATIDEIGRQVEELVDVTRFHTERASERAS